MHKFSRETLELFRIHQFGTAKHLDKITSETDRNEIDRARALFAKKSKEQQVCQDCVENLKLRGFVCELHFHDYLNQGPDCCWTCYVLTIHEEQLELPLD